jgi:hypothetical protein
LLSRRARHELPAQGRHLAPVLLAGVHGRGQRQVGQERVAPLAEVVPPPRRRAAARPVRRPQRPVEAGKQGAGALTHGELAVVRARDDAPALAAELPLEPLREGGAAAKRVLVDRLLPGERLPARLAEADRRVNPRRVGAR